MAKYLPLVIAAYLFIAVLPVHAFEMGSPKQEGYSSASGSEEMILFRAREKVKWGKADQLSSKEKTLIEKYGAKDQVPDEEPLFYVEPSDDLPTGLYKTSGGKFPFCRTKSELSLLADLVKQGYKDRALRMVNKGPCIMLQENLLVRLEGTSSSGWLKVRLADNGMILYTVKGAIQ